jgi:hypothetical protein
MAVNYSSHRLELWNGSIYDCAELNNVTKTGTINASSRACDASWPEPIDPQSVFDDRCREDYLGSGATLADTALGADLAMQPYVDRDGGEQLIFPVESVAISWCPEVSPELLPVSLLMTPAQAKRKAQNRAAYVLSFNV